MLNLLLVLAGLSGSRIVIHAKGSGESASADVKKAKAFLETR